MSDFGSILEMQRRRTEAIGRWYGRGLTLALLCTVFFTLGWVTHFLVDDMQWSAYTLPTLLANAKSGDFLQLSGAFAGMSTWLGAKSWNAHQQKMVLLIAHALDLEGDRNAALRVLVGRALGGDAGHMAAMPDLRT